MPRQSHTFPCDSCEATFATSEALSAHKEDRHTLGEFTCIWCGRVFLLNVGLREHGPRCTVNLVESGNEYYCAPKPERKSVEEAFGVRHQTAVLRAPRASSSTHNTQGDRRVDGGSYSTLPAAPPNLDISQQTYESYSNPQYMLSGPAEMQYYPPHYPQPPASSSSDRGQLEFAEYHHAHDYAQAQAQAQAQYTAGDPVSEEQQQQQLLWHYEYPPASGA